LLKTSIYIQIVIRWASIHRLSICIIDLPTTGDLKHYEWSSGDVKPQSFVILWFGVGDSPWFSEICECVTFSGKRKKGGNDNNK
jgi:hypothetical protein